MRWRLLIALQGACLAWGLWSAVVDVLPEASDAAWLKLRPRMPPASASIAGALRPDPAALDLSLGQGVIPRTGNFHDGTLSLRARVPQGSQLHLGFGAESHVTPPRADVTVVIDRTSRMALSAQGLQCSPAQAPEQDFRLDVLFRGEQIDLRVNDSPWSSCKGRWSGGSVLLSSGVSRLQVRDFELRPDGHPPFVDRLGSFWRKPAAGALFSLLTALLLGLVPLLPPLRARFSLRGREAAVAIAGAPFLLIPLLGFADMAASLEALRMLSVPPSFGPLLLAGIPGLIALLGLLASCRGFASPLLAALGPLLGVGILVLALRKPPDSPGWLILAGLAIPFSAIVVLNTRPVRWHGLLSLLLSVLLLVQAELGLRWTALNQSWAPTQGWERARSEFQELLEIRRFRRYPDQGFPVQPPAPDPERRRIVALGGSSTGGAFQMDDIELFWPRKLQDRVAERGWEVVNQGVGGWNSLHVRLYVESQIERLDADLLAIYIGHNDLLSFTPVPYRELLRRYEREAAGSGRSSLARSLSSTLDRVRLYSGLRFALLSLRDREQAVAVPPSDARENLAAIIALAQSHQARVLLMTEGLNPDPSPMEPYGEMLSSLALESGSLYLDAARALYLSGDTSLFLDDCHLSEAGHRLLAERVDEHLSASGWLQGGAPPGPSQAPAP